MALDRGFDVIGRDVNPKCVDGTISNLRHLHSEGRWQIDTCDSAVGSLPINGHIDCVVSNLPWGLNSIQYIDDNRRILTSIREQIRPGTPCAFITKEDIPFLDDLGYETVEKASVPTANFELPLGKRKESSSLNLGGEKKRNSCIVVLAKAV